MYVDVTPGSPTFNQSIRPVQLYSYSALGQLIQVRAGRTDAGGIDPAADVVSSQIQSIYDDLGRVIKQWDALGSAATRFTAFVYDVHGNVIQRTDPRGLTTTYSWTYGHRLSGRVSSAGNTAFSYNALGLVTEATTYPAGSTTTPLTRYGFVYAPGRRVSQVLDYRTTPTKTLTYSYSPGGMRVSRADGEGRTVSYQYDAVGRISSVRFPDNATLTYAFDPGGRLTRKSYPNGALANYRYHPNDSLIQVTHGWPAT